MHESNLHLVVTQFFILFFKKQFEKDQKNKQNKLKTYILDIFALFLTSFLKNLKLKNNFYHTFLSKSYSLKKYLSFT